MLAREIFAHEPHFEVEVLDLSRLASEYGRVIYPCKTCVSTAMPLCHWPCSCYPNHALGQVQDWMNDIYAMWAAAHGVMIVCPVNWYGPPSGLKLMMDRLVCADGGNPDPTSTARQECRTGQGARDRRLALSATSRRPRVLGGRAWRLRRRGEAVHAAIADWLRGTGLIEAGQHVAACAARRLHASPTPPATTTLDRDTAFQEEARNAARSLVEAVKLRAVGNCSSRTRAWTRPRKK